MLIEVSPYIYNNVKNSLGKKSGKYWYASLSDRLVGFLTPASRLKAESGVKQIMINEYVKAESQSSASGYSGKHQASRRKSPHKPK